MLKKTNEEMQELSSMQRMLGNPEESRLIDLVQKLSPKGKMVQRTNEYGVFLEKNAQTNEYGINCFSEKEIIDECKKYNLIMIHCNDYTGDYDLNFIKKVDESIKDAKLNKVDGDSYGNAFYLVGKRKHGKIMRKTTDFADGKIRMAFYKVPGSPYYAMLNNNDSHINIVSIYKGYKFRNEANLRITQMLENSMVALFICALLRWQYGWFTNFGPWAIFFTLLGIAVLSFVAMLIRMAAAPSHVSDTDHDPDYFLDSLTIGRSW